MEPIGLDVDSAGSRLERRGQALGSPKSRPPRLSGDARTRPVLSKNCREAALAGSGTAAPRGQLPTEQIELRLRLRVVTSRGPPY